MIVKNKSHNSVDGFTLIELLVVIAIIGILSSVVLASLNSARAKARDTKRLSDMKVLHLAFETAKADGILLPQIYQNTSTGTGIINFLIPTYISSPVIEDYPFSTNTADLYYYCNVNTQSSGNICHNDDNNDTYAIRFRTETNTSVGTAGYYCLTSMGIFPRETGNNGTNKCLQR